MNIQQTDRFSVAHFMGLGNKRDEETQKLSVAGVLLDDCKGNDSKDFSNLSSRVVDVTSEPLLVEVTSISANSKQTENVSFLSSMRQKIKTVAFYTFAAVASVAVVGLLISQGSSCVHQGLAFREGRQLKEQIDALRRSGDPHWQDKAIALIEAARKDSPREDLNRLRGAGVLDSWTEQKLDDALNNVEIVSSTPTSVALYGAVHVKKLYGQALEIKKLYQDTFHVFLHAQASPWLPISDLVKELWSAKGSTEDFHHFVPLRAPCSTASAGVMESICRGVDSINPFASTGIGQFRDRWFQPFTLSDTDPKVGEELLSVDGYFFNNYIGKSSMSFLRNNTNINIFTGVSKIEEVAEKAIRHFAPSLSEGRSRYLAKKVVKTTDSLDHPCGNLFVLCIPKEQSPEIQYRSHSFGWACDCHPKEEAPSILDKLQKDQFDASTACSSLLYPSSFPQFRLYLPAIQPGTGKKVFLLSPLKAKERQKMQESIHAIAGQVCS